MIESFVHLVNSFSTEDSSYFSALLSTLVLSSLVPYVPPGEWRKWFCTVCGVGFSVALCQLQAAYLAALVTATHCVTSLVSIKHWKPVSFFLLFIYISTLRLLHVFSIWNLNPFVNGVLMISVLKLISCVFDRRDSVYAKRLISQVSISIIQLKFQH